MTYRSAPRRFVKRQWKTGDYATTVWHSELDCGHTDRRRRKPVAERIGCLQCEAEEKVETAGGAIAVADRDSTLAVNTAVLRAQLASALRITPDSVVIEVDRSELLGARILLFPRQIEEIIERN
jgi:hypothetical protein